MRSGLVLGSSKPGVGYGVLRLGEIMSLHLDSDLVTLSACQSGLGTLVRGEGMVGLTRAFLFAGARRLAVSLWSVNDETTPDFMVAFYKLMRSGQSPTEALRQTKLAMLKSNTASFHHPYFWAPFVLVGLP
jgi:CHAT domain-containing protein